MVCESCGEKPKKCDKDFTKAVIEINNESIVLLRKVVVPVSLGDDETFPPKIGKYRNVILQYEANNHIYIYSSDGIPTLLETEVPQSVLDRISNLEEDVVDLENGLDELSQEFEDFKNSPDVVDIVATYADLQAYDTSALGDNDIIRVLADETHNDASTYYRWNKTASQWVYIGASGPYYTKSETDALIDAAKTEWAGTETTNSDSGDTAEVTTTTGDFTWADGNTVTINFKYKALRGSLNIDNTGAYSIDNVRSLEGGIDSGVAIQYVCVMINNQRYYRPIGRLRASSDVAGPVFLANNLTTTNALTALSANQGKVLNESITSVSGRVTTNADNISTLQTSKQDKLTAGTNIAITAQNVISATDTTYTAGNATTIDSTDNNRIDAAIYPADFFTGGPTVSGEGSTITLNNTIAAPIDSLELNGDTFQQTYTGKNLLPFTTQNFVVNNMTYKSVGGILYMDGTSSGETYTNNANFKSNFAFTLPAGTYTLSLDEGLTTINIKKYSDDSNLATINGTTIKNASFTLAETTQVYLGFYVYQLSLTNRQVLLQLESGSTANSFEPYVGGTASPNPDYPQDIQVVTGEQTVNVHTANLYDEQQLSLVSGWTRLNDGIIEKTVNYTGNIPSYYDNSVYNPIGTYTISYELRIANPSTTALIMENRAYIWNKTSTSLKDADGNNVTQAYRTLNSEWKKFSFTITTTESLRWNDGKALHLYMASRTGEPVLQLRHFQIEEGSTASKYQPFQSQTYTVNLGSIELCKIGTYQDYIYKSGDDWYVHKELGYTLLSSLTWESRTWGYSGGTLTDAQPAANNNTIASAICSCFILTTANNCYGLTGSVDKGIAISNIKELLARDTSITVLQDFEDAINGQKIYYVLATPTNAQITDTTLIGQLNALYNAKMLDGQTNLAVSAVSPNLPAILDVSLLAKTLSGVLSFIDLKQDKLLAGANITISDNTISADSPTWTFTTTDPGEGGTLAPNNFIGVYE